MSITVDPTIAAYFFYCCGSACFFIGTVILWAAKVAS